MWKKNTTQDSKDTKVNLQIYSTNGDIIATTRRRDLIATRGWVSKSLMVTLLLAAPKYIEPANLILQMTVSPGFCSRWLLFIEFNFLKTLDFSQYIFRLGFHLKVCQIAAFMIYDTHLVLDGVQHL